MTTIEVTSPLSEPAATLALHTCATCGRHVWERDGVELDRGAVLAVVKDRIAEGPSARLPRPRTSRPRVPTDVSLPTPAPARLAEFTVHRS